MILSFAFSFMSYVQAAAYPSVDVDFTNKFGDRYRIELRPIRTTLCDRLALEKTFGSAVPMSKYMDGRVRPQEEIDRRFQNYTEWTNHKGYPWVCMMAFLKSVDPGTGRAEESQTLAPGLFLGELVIEPWNDNGDAELSYVLVEECWNKGICTELVRRLVELTTPCLQENSHMFKIERLWATARPDNVGSWRILEKNSFIKEVGIDGQAVIGAVHSSTGSASSAPTDRWQYYLPITPNTATTAAAADG